ncbi:universal stress protein [Sulfolobus acidocaldarius DSM 639]|uniref:Universal stress protein n=4 Tax=Sulfolobus acidocaldarius TaxID=2285 RepID=Q4J8D1_SULAC|nr:universal stress protein [Sulfolobus acidocaldarius DSM 639]
MFKKIVVAYDGSDNANRALDVAIDLAKKYDAKLDVVQVVDTSALLGMGLAPVPNDLIQQVYSKAKSDVENAKSKATNQGIKEVDGIVLEGDPASSIVEYSSKSGANLIVTGSRGLSTFKRLLLGSVSTKIAQESRIPVLIVK